MKTLHTVSPGGVLSTGSLRQLATHCLTADASIRIGPRMQLEVLLPDHAVPDFSNRLREWMEFSADRCNVVSSACAQETHPWLKESALLEACEQMHSAGTGLDISLLDPGQSLVPLYLSELNFLAQPEEGTWCCAIRAVDGKVHQTAGRILTQDPAQTAAVYSALRAGGPQSAVQGPGGPAVARTNECLRPEYEGFQKHHEKWSLGFFSSSGTYDAALIEEMAYLCNRDSLGKVYLTPWQSFLIKGIPEASRPEWQDFVRRRAIETRHASAELFWRMLDPDPLLYAARRRIASALARTETPVFGSFSAGLCTQDDLSEFSIELAGKFPARFRLFERQPGQARRKIGTVLLPFLPGAVQKHLAGKQTEVRLLKEPEPAAAEERNAQEQIEKADGSYACIDCLNVYAPQYGDSFSGQPPGTPFELLPASYECPVCGAGKNQFRRAA